MTIELPILRLGLAGFTAEQQASIERFLAGARRDTTVWRIAELDGSDAWWVNGARTQLLGHDRIRIAAAEPSGHSLQLHLPDVDRPLAFGHPLPAGMQPLLSFDPADSAAAVRVLDEFENWLAPLRAQFTLASDIVRNETALGGGVFDVTRRGRTLAVVDMHGDAGVLPSVQPWEFEDAIWTRRGAGAQIPRDFVRASLSQLMWQYAVRTQLDVLPKHYRTNTLYFRRPPRLPQRLVRDSHLLLMRELSLSPSSFQELRHRCGVQEDALARDLAALYFVGSITSNPKRAGPSVRGVDSGGGLPSNLPSELEPDSIPDRPGRRPIAPSDTTAPGALGPR